MIIDKIQADLDRKFSAYMEHMQKKMDAEMEKYAAQMQSALDQMLENTVADTASNNNQPILPSQEQDISMGSNQQKELIEAMRELSKFNYTLDHMMAFGTFCGDMVEKNQEVNEVVLINQIIKILQNDRNNQPDQNR